MMEVTAPGDFEKWAALLAATPGIQFQHDGGLVLRKFTITGDAEALAKLKPKLDELESDYVSGEAW